METENPIEPTTEREIQQRFGFEPLIEEYIAKGFRKFNSLNKVLAIDSYETDGKKIAFTLKSEIGEYFHFDCQTNKLMAFLGNFEQDIKENNNIDMHENEKEQKGGGTISELRNTLFETIELLKAGRMEYQTAKTISDLSQTILNSAKVELEYRKINGGKVKMLE